MPDIKQIKAIIQKLGYDIEDKIEDKKEEKNNLKIKQWQDLFWALIIITIIGLILKLTGLLNIETKINIENLNLGGVWLIGLIAGLSTCMALVGGIIIALSADYVKKHPEASRLRKFQPHLYFNLGRIIGFFILGGVLGSLGSIIKISSLASSWLSLIVGILIIFLGLQVLDIFPFLNRFSFTLPKKIFKIIPIKNKEKYNLYGAIVAGILSFFLPCGFTQSMQIYALSSGQFIQGAMIMAIFALGTTVSFIGLGGIISLIKGKYRSIFLKTAGLIVIIFGVFNFYNAYKVLSLHFNNKLIISTENQKNNNKSEIQIIKMEQNSHGYNPNYFQIEVNRPVRWIINSTNPYSCASSLIVPSLKINKQLKSGENIIEFTPKQTGKIKFSCSMGMYNGVIDVVTVEEIKNNKINKQQNNNLPICNINGCQ